MPWQKSYDEIEVIEKAMRAFWARGYEATSMNDLVEATGINRGSIYAVFPSKHALFMRALQHYDRKYREHHLEQIAARHDPLEAIMAVFASAACRPEDDATPWGCLLVNTALELSPHDSEIREFVDRSLRAVEEFFHEQLRLARERGLGDANLDPGSTAKSLLGLFLGLRVLTRAQADRSTIEAIVSRARIMLG